MEKKTTLKQSTLLINQDVINNVINNLKTDMVLL